MLSGSPARWSTGTRVWTRAVMLQNKLHGAVIQSAMPVVKEDLGLLLSSGHARTVYLSYLTPSCKRGHLGAPLPERFEYHQNSIYSERCPARSLFWPLGVSLFPSHRLCLLLSAFASCFIAGFLVGNRSPSGGTGPAEEDDRRTTQRDSPQSGPQRALKSGGRRRGRRPRGKG
jgi:hypothetical protein